MARTITFQPSETMDDFIASLVSSGSYNSQSEVIRAGIRLLEEQIATSNLQQLRQLIDDGDNSQDAEDFSMDSIKKRLNDS